jgi:hypothetical protein
MIDSRFKWADGPKLRPETRSGLSESAIVLARNAKLTHLTADFIFITTLWFVPNGLPERLMRTRWT